MLTVLADDITGAAEIAGIATSKGLRALLAVIAENDSASRPMRFPQEGTDVCVIATDIRSEGTHLLSSEQQGIPLPPPYAKGQGDNGAEQRFFLKTDSVLRGHIVKTIALLMRRYGYDSALLIAQNPSKGRTINNGTYFIDGKPLAETAFSYDPEFPALSSEATEILHRNANWEAYDGGTPLPEVVSLKTDGKIFDDGKIYVADASCSEDILRQYAKANGSTLLAGGADFFGCVMENIRNETPLAATDSVPQCPIACDGKKTLIVRGSTQSKPIQDSPILKAADTAMADIPDDVFEGAPADTFIHTATEEYMNHDVFIMSVGDHAVKGQEYAVRLKNVMADAAASFVKAQLPATVIIEGGATAFCILSRLHWLSFNVTAEYAPGVVEMQCLAQTPSGETGKVNVILKPGSYPWGKLFA